MGRKLAFFDGRTPEQSIRLYPADGTSDSISDGNLGVPAFTIELGIAFFQSCTTYSSAIKPNNLAAFKPGRMSQVLATLARAPPLASAKVGSSI